MTAAFRRIEAQDEYCMGCGLCRLACQVAHSAYPLNIVKAMKTGGRPIPRMSVETSTDGMSFRSIRCLQCEDPECVKICISGAATRDEETGIVLIDELKCVGCWSCVIACPEGAITGPAAGRGKAYKCDFCIERGFPACVSVCPNQALIIREDVESTTREG